MQGYQPETVKKLIKALSANIETKLGIPPVDVEIAIQYKQPPYASGFRGLTGERLPKKVIWIITSMCDALNAECAMYTKAG